MCLCSPYSLWIQLTSLVLAHDGATRPLIQIITSSSKNEDWLQNCIHK